MYIYLQRKCMKIKYKKKIILQIEFYNISNETERIYSTTLWDQIENKTERNLTNTNKQNGKFYAQGISDDTPRKNWSFKSISHTVYSQYFVCWMFSTALLKKKCKKKSLKYGTEELQKEIIYLDDTVRKWDK